MWDPPGALTGWGGRGSRTAPPRRSRGTPHCPGDGSTPGSETGPSAGSGSPGSLAERQGGCDETDVMDRWMEG